MDQKNENDLTGTNNGAAACLRAGELAAQLDDRTKTFGGVPTVLLSSGQKLEIQQTLLAIIDQRAAQPLGA